MKFYKSVLKRKDEDNYKKGIIRITTDSGIYKTTKILYYLSFAWFMLFHGLYLISNTTAFFFFERAAQNIHMELFVTSVVIFVLMVFAAICIKKNWQIPAFAATLVGGIAQIVALQSNDNITLSFLSDGILSSKFFWYHHAPIILLIFFTLILFVIGIKIRIELMRDYTRTLTSMFTAYSEENNGASDAQWTAHLEELDHKLAQEDKE
ncbi:MAG: hypothetical protein J6Q74_02260 [Clostridia bacterium]|nr:hypothetical protein [Clostridia bacterium]